jgi:hypothetical protein
MPKTMQLAPETMGCGRREESSIVFRLKKKVMRKFVAPRGQLRVAAPHRTCQTRGIRAKAPAMTRRKKNSLASISGRRRAIQVSAKFKLKKKLI